MVSSKLQRSAAVVLANAIARLFPGTLFVKIGCDPVSFYCDFMPAHSLDKSALPLLEEQMNNLIKETDEIQSLEMMSGNAADFFRDRKQFQWASLLKKQGNILVDICKIGSFYCWSSGPYVDLADLKFLKLVTVEQQDEEVVRVLGIAAEDKQTLKDFVKKRKTGPKNSYDVVGKEQGLFDFVEYKKQQQRYWTVRGEALRQVLLAWLRGFYSKNGFAVVSMEMEGPPHLKHALMYQQHGFSYCADVAEHGDDATVFCGIEGVRGEIKALVAMVQNMMDHFKLNYTCYLVGSGKDKEFFEGIPSLEYDEDYDGDLRLEFYVEDVFGAPQLVSHIGIDRTKSLSLDEGMLALTMTLWESLDGFIGLLVEYYCRVGWPLWAVPEQVALIPVKERNAFYAKELLAKMQSFGLRVNFMDGDDKVAARIYSANTLFIPYVLIIGDREQESGTVTVRCEGAGDVLEGVQIDEWIQTLVNF